MASLQSRPIRAVLAMAKHIEKRTNPIRLYSVRNGNFVTTFGARSMLDLVSSLINPPRSRRERDRGAIIAMRGNPLV